MILPIAARAALRLFYFFPISIIKFDSSYRCESGIETGCKGSKFFINATDSSYRCESGIETLRSSKLDMREAIHPIAT